MICAVSIIAHVDELSRVNAPEDPSEPCMAKKVSVAGSESAAQ